jgi:hypothetical protein
VADRLKQFFLGPANMAKINQLESEYMSRFPSLVENLGSTGVFSDARHAAATSLMSDRLGGIPYVSDTLANLGGGIRELGGFAAEMKNPSLKGSSMEDLRANALAFDYPAGTTAEEIYADIFSKAAARQSAEEFAGTGLQYGQAQAAIPDDQINLPGEATAYLASQGYNLGKSASGSVPSGTSTVSAPSDAISKSSATVDDPTSRLPQVPKQTYMDGIMRALNPTEAQIISRINAANNAQPMIDTSYFSSGFQPAPRSTRFDGFAPRVGRSDQAIFGDQLIASRQPRNLIGRDPLAQFDGSPTSEAAKLALQNQRNVMRQSIKDQSPSGIESLIGTIISLATGIPVNLGSNLKTINRKGTELSRAFAQGLGIPRRETTGIVYGDSGRGYTPGELNRMNAAGGYYSEPARQQRRRERRVEKMLERKAAGKKYSQKNLNKLTTGGSKPGTYTVKGAGSAGESKSKIVCTMMNERYGFGSFRNKIWMKFHESYGPEYQKGYHAIFLPLVKIAKGEGKINTAVRKILEHMGRHVTADMFKIMKGKKRDPLGRIYRAIFEPTCRIIGKIKSALGRG